MYIVMYIYRPGTVRNLPAFLDNPTFNLTHHLTLFFQISLNMKYIIELVTLRISIILNLRFEHKYVEVVLYTPPPEHNLLQVEVQDCRLSPPYSCNLLDLRIHNQDSSHKPEPGSHTRHRNLLQDMYHKDPEPRDKTPDI